ncbi:MAG TPA: response regulator [Rhodanobacter sp.]|nr:response regulator [Rhodanobacter sp.]
MSECPKTTRSPSSGQLRPRVLVADDDAGSCRYLSDGLWSLGAVADTFVDGETALERARTEAFDLLLLDCRMPGGGAMHILTQLRSDTHASSTHSVAVATSAEVTSADRRNLLAAGFSDVLRKPCTLTELQRVLHLVEADRPSAVLDDGAALSSSGDASTMHALRRLLRDELVVLERDLDGLSLDVVAFADRLHRLRSACGFCGVTALAQQTVLMQQRLSSDGANPAKLASFRTSLHATLQALERQDAVEPPVEPRPTTA